MANAWSRWRDLIGVICDKKVANIGNSRKGNIINRYEDGAICNWCELLKLCRNEEILTENKRRTDCNGYV